jgi:O-acetyl-ADP-ribose deacetylase (regulator of RNase III)
LRVVVAVFYDNDAASTKATPQSRQSAPSQTGVPRNRGAGGNAPAAGVQQPRAKATTSRAPNAKFYPTHAAPPQSQGQQKGDVSWQRTATTPQSRQSAPSQNDVPRNRGASGNAPAAGAQQTKAKAVTSCTPSVSSRSTVDGNLDQRTIVVLKTGDILQVRADAVVCPCSDTLNHKGKGLAAAIAKAAGPTLMKECKDILQDCDDLPFGHVVHTTSGKMKDRLGMSYVVHVVGMQFNQHMENEELCQAAKESFYSCLRYANDELRIKSLSCPAIGAGN